MTRTLLVPRAAAVIITAGALWIAPPLAAGQNGSVPTSRTADRKPDLSGFWAGTGNALQTEADGDLIYTATSRDGSAVNFERDDTLRRRMDRNRPLYKPEFWDRLQELDNDRNRADSFFSCAPAGLPRMGPPTKIVQTATEVIFLYATRTTFRVIPIDGRAHHPVNSQDQTFMGDSVGHWEGGTLVVDVRGFNDTTWLDYQGYFHTTDLHVVERFRRDANRLIYDVTVDDPQVLLKPWTMTTRTLILNTDPTAIMIEDSPCDERDLEHLVTKEHH